MPADVESDEQLDAVFETLQKEWGTLDFLVHSLAFSDREELKGRYVDTSCANFCQKPGYLLLFFHGRSPARRKTDAAGRQSGDAFLSRRPAGDAQLQCDGHCQGGAGSQRALSRGRSGRDNIRVNAISAGSMRTLAGAAVGDARMVFKWNKAIPR
jgi:enoyl-[acyl-carrier protein] reductase I